MAQTTSNTFDESGHLTPWGQGQMDRLAASVGWVSYPGALPFTNGDDELTDTALLWLTQISQRGSLPLPATHAEGLPTLLAQYGVV